MNGRNLHNLDVTHISCYHVMIICSKEYTATYNVACPVIRCNQVIYLSLVTRYQLLSSHQQLWMPCSQIMEQLLVVQARHRLRWHRQSAGSRYTWDFRFQKAAIKSTSTMILNATCKSYTLVPHGFRSIFRVLEHNCGVWPFDWILVATCSSEIIGPNFENQFFRASNLTWHLWIFETRFNKDKRLLQIEEDNGCMVYEATDRISFPQQKQFPDKVRDQISMNNSFSK